MVTKMIVAPVSRCSRLISIRMLSRSFRSEGSDCQQRRLVARWRVTSLRRLWMLSLRSKAARQHADRDQATAPRHRCDDHFRDHDQEEALALADRICLINEGRIEQLGTPEEIYEQPRNAFVAEFIGISNMMHGRIEAGMSIRTKDGLCHCRRLRAATGDSGVLVIRPEKIAFCTADEALVSGQVEESIYAGSETKLLVRLRAEA